MAGLPEASHGCLLRPSRPAWPVRTGPTNSPRLAAAHRKLIGPSLSRRARREIADRIHELTYQISRLGD
ncbi:hypothetical protein AB0M05_41505 [Streptomyces violaceusniger]|uniref:hypothetical protein n=1 Tax=Streptomyces violaceusniger TaxID=68280 RepID=UPI0034221FF9